MKWRRSTFSIAHIIIVAGRGYPLSIVCMTSCIRHRLGDLALDIERNMKRYIIFAILFNGFVQFGCSINCKSTVIVGHMLSYAPHQSMSCLQLLTIMRPM